MLTAELRGTIPATVLFSIDLGGDLPPVHSQHVVEHETVRAGKAREYLRGELLEMTAGYLRRQPKAAELAEQVERIVAEEFDGVMEGLERKPAV